MPRSSTTVSEPAGAPATPAASLAGWCAVALVVALPLAFWPPAFGPFHATKWFVVCVVVPSGLAAAAVAGILRWPRWRWFLPWIAVSVLATVLGVAPWMSLYGSPNRNDGLLALAIGTGAFVLAASVGGDPGVQRRVLRAAMLTGAAVGALAVAERFGLDLAGLGDVGELSRARSTWGSATFAGAHLVMVLPIAVVLLRGRDPRWRVAATVSTVAIAAGLVATGTRAAWLAAVLAAVVAFPAWRHASVARAQGGAVGGSRAARIAMVVAILLALAVAGVFTAPQLGRSSALGRLDLWSTTPSVIADRPWLGSGPDTQRVVLPGGADDVFERAHGSEELHDRAHSLPLDTLVTTGLLGLVALVALLGVLGRDIAIGLRRRLVPTAVAAGLAAYLATLLFAFGGPALDPLAWLLAGMLWVAVSGERDTAGAHRRTSTRAATATGFGALALAGLVWSGGEVLAETRLQRALDASGQGDLTAALDHVDAAVSLAPARFDIHQVGARLATRSLVDGTGPPGGTGVPDGLVDEAVGHLDAAQRIAGPRDPDLLMDRADLLTATDQAQRAVEMYAQVFEAYPNSSRAFLGLGLALSRLGDDDGAADAWRTAADLAPGDARPLVNLGILAEQRGDPDQARELFERALQVAPDDIDAVAGLDRLGGAPE